MDNQKILELRIAVLHDLRESIPDGWYARLSKEGDKFAKDFLLRDHIFLQNERNPKLSLRQFAAAELLYDIGYYFCLDYHYEPADEGSTIESTKESALLLLQESVDDYVRHLSPDEARVLQVSGSANEPPADAHKEINKGTDNNKET